MVPSLFLEDSYGWGLCHDFDWKTTRHWQRSFCGTNLFGFILSSGKREPSYANTKGFQNKSIYNEQLSCFSANDVEPNGYFPASMAFYILIESNHNFLSSQWCV